MTVKKYSDIYGMFLKDKKQTFDVIKKKGYERKIIDTKL